MEIEFESFPKIPRLSRPCTITEKIDGTNASIKIIDESEIVKDIHNLIDYKVVNGSIFLVGSRTRWITPEDDNYGFARWAYEHAEELVKGLGFGHHFGEWWGQGIQRGYDLKEKRFSLFNVSKWNDDTVRPKCCHVVPTIFRGTFSTDAVLGCLDRLVRQGSKASNNFKFPEGIMVYHEAAGMYFKKTILKDEAPKGRE